MRGSHISFSRNLLHRNLRSQLTPSSHPTQTLEGFNSATFHTANSRYLLAVMDPNQPRRIYLISCPRSGSNLKILNLSEQPNLVSGKYFLLHICSAMSSTPRQNPSLVGRQTKKLPSHKAPNPASTPSKPSQIPQPARKKTLTKNTATSSLLPLLTHTSSLKARTTSLQQTPSRCLKPPTHLHYPNSSP
jgi:hypothetical protein